MKVVFEFMSHAFTVLFVCTGLSITLAACSVSDRLVYEDAEGVVPQSFFSTVKKNKTHKRWIVDNLGSPHFSVEGPNQEEIYTYHFKQSRYRKTSFLLVLNYNGSENQQINYHVLLCDDVVKKAWWDQFVAVEVDKLSRDSDCGESKTEMEARADKTDERFEIPAPVDAAKVG
ncbi:hypothetical protein [Agaribacterium haliotis]|uniref:hypothetical protein n=1 Tax=Agaribacterium haliotis TaxID=2013869 RepID=UPI000BB54799|nr:hypothetical protein [Agaribacterium haliotis]